MHLLEQLKELIDGLLQPQDRLELVLDLSNRLLELGVSWPHHLLHYQLESSFRVFLHLIQLIFGDIRVEDSDLPLDF